MTDMIGRKTAVTTEATIVTTTATNPALTQFTETPAYGPAFCLPRRKLGVGRSFAIPHSAFVTLLAYPYTRENCCNPSTPNRHESRAELFALPWYGRTTGNEAP
jgi:hypothetical protein